VELLERAVRLLTEDEENDPELEVERTIPNPNEAQQQVNQTLSPGLRLW
jgi:hypothetical protein